MPVAGALAAVSPLAVTHSQLVLADMTGACFATLLLALVPRAVANIRLAPWLGGVAGLAAASKFHFGIWLLLPLAAMWTARPDAMLKRRERWAATLVLLVIFGLVLVAFVPWLWTNAPLGLKEFAGVVLVKAAGGAGGATALVANAATVLGGLGAGIVLGAVVGVRPLVRQCGAIGGAVLALTVLAVGLLCASAIVFDRYGLVVLPAFTLAATAGWQSIGRRWPRLGGILPITLVLLGLPQSWFALDEFRHRNSYHLAHAWMIARLPDRASVVIHSEDNQYLPRTLAQLAECESYMSDRKRRIERSWPPTASRLRRTPACRCGLPSSTTSCSTPTGVRERSCRPDSPHSSSVAFTPGHGSRPWMCPPSSESSARDSWTRHGASTPSLCTGPCFPI